MIRYTFDNHVAKEHQDMMKKIALMEDQSAEAVASGFDKIGLLTTDLDHLNDILDMFDNGSYGIGSLVEIEQILNWHYEWPDGGLLYRSQKALRMFKLLAAIDCGLNQPDAHIVYCNLPNITEVEKIFMDFLDRQYRQLQEQPTKARTNK